MTKETSNNLYWFGFVVTMLSIPIQGPYGWVLMGAGVAVQFYSIFSSKDDE